MTEAYVHISFVGDDGQNHQENHTIDHGGNFPPIADISQDALKASKDTSITITHNHGRDGNVVFIGTKKVFIVKPGQNITKKFANATYTIDHCK
jgi:hypothetical protein